jgi:hypothetical protein
MASSRWAGVLESQYDFSSDGSNTDATVKAVFCIFGIPDIFMLALYQKRQAV